MKKIITYILILCFMIPFTGCTDKKAELQKQYDDISYKVTQDQKQIDDLQEKMDLDNAARADADKSGATSDTEYGKVVAQQDDETLNEAIKQMHELQTQLETDKLQQESIKNQLDKLK